MLLFGGLFLNVESSPVWINWIKYLSWMLYSYEALVTNEMFGLKVRVSLEGVDKVEVGTFREKKKVSRLSDALSRSL
jgi:hypothetical protein